MDFLVLIRLDMADRLTLRLNLYYGIRCPALGLHQKLETWTEAQCYFSYNCSVKVKL